MEDKTDDDTLFGDEDNDKNALAEINFDVNIGRWLLKVIGGPNNGAEFSMYPGSSYVLGTDPNSCDIVFHDTSVSRQHARLSIDTDDGMSIEDLKSRNGTIVDGEAIKGKKKLSANTVVTLGTSSFTIYDREGEMHTLISPLLPDIVRVLQKDSPVPVAAVRAPEADSVAPPPPPEMIKALENTNKRNTAEAFGALIVLGILTGLFAIIGIGTYTLFKGESVEMRQTIDPMVALDPVFQKFPTVRYYYNKGTGNLQLIGHVVTQADKNQILQALRGYPFIRDLDDSDLVVDEYAWTEVNHVLSKNPNWKGISMQSLKPGKFTLTGSLQTRAEAAQLYDYITGIFPYLDRLEKNVVIEEDILNDAQSALRKNNLRELSLQLVGGSVTLTGKITRDKQEALQQAILEIEQILGIRSVKNSVIELEPEQAVIDLSGRFDVTGISRRGSSYSVVVQGRVLSVGDELEGMLIREIRPNAILLDKDGVKYRIDFSR